MLAQCYDVAANICGGYKGVSTRFKEICRRVFYIHCNGHILNLVLIDAAKSITTSRNSFGIIAQLHKFIEGSSKRHAVFEAFQIEGMKAFSLKKLSDTRWSCRVDVLRVLRLRLEEVKLTLEEIDDNDYIQS